MSPRVIHIPLSGRDRKHYVRELKRVEQLQRELARKAEGAYAAAAEHLAMAHRYACEEWNARQFLGCQSALNFDPVSASNFDPFARRGLRVALDSSELAGIAETRRARVA
jgi:hypothetical protein